MEYKLSFLIIHGCLFLWDGGIFLSLFVHTCFLIQKMFLNFCTIMLFYNISSPMLPFPINARYFNRVVSWFVGVAEGGGGMKPPILWFYCLIRSYLFSFSSFPLHYLIAKGKFFLPFCLFSPRHNVFKRSSPQVMSIL